LERQQPLSPQHLLKLHLKRLLLKRPLKRKRKKRPLISVDSETYSVEKEVRKNGICI
jgi:hypothetical protein